jgi:hypothetical protein
MVPYSKAHSKGKSTKTDKTDKKLNHLSFQSTEQLKNNIFLTNATVSSLYCIALYDNYIALNNKVQK